MQNEPIQSSLFRNYLSSQNAAGQTASFQMPAPNLLQNGATSSAITPITFKPNIESDSVNLSNKKDPEKKKKIAKIILLATIAAIATVGGIAAIRNRNSIKKYAEQIYKDIKSGKTAKDFKDATLELKETANNVQDKSKRQNFLDGIINAKDTLQRKIMSKIPGYKYYDDATASIYKSATRKATEANWKKAAEVVKNSDDAILAHLNKSKLNEAEIGELTGLLQERGKTIENLASSDNIKIRCKKLNEAFEGVHEEGWTTLTDKAKTLKEKFNGLFEKSIAQDKVDNAQKIHDSLIKSGKYYGLDNENKAKRLIELIKKATGDNQELLKQAEKANKAYTNAYAKEAVDLFSKTRDINFGSAATDIQTVLLATAGLGIYTHQADTKQEKIGVTLTTGIPLLTTLATTTYCTMKMISGGKSLPIGLATGFIAKKIGEFINKKYQEKTGVKQVNTIPTLDDYNEAILKNIKQQQNKIFKQ